MNVDWRTAGIVIAYGAACWLAGWHISIRASGKMFDEGFREGYRAGRKETKKETDDYSI